MAIRDLVADRWGGRAVREGGVRTRRQDHLLRISHEQLSSTETQTVEPFPRRCLT